MNYNAKILIACEESGVVCSAFHSLGFHNTWSCDLQDTSGPLPNFHLKCDVRTILGEAWDMIIAFPDCTHLAVSGARWFPEKRADGRQQAGIDFFMLFANHPCPKIVIENPVGIMSTVWKKPTQCIQPYEYGHGETKKTCLWLKGLPKLVPTNIVLGREQKVWKMGPSPDRAKLRSKTYPGIAKCMADTWGPIL